VRTLNMWLGGDGIVVVDLDGRDEDGKLLGYGLYWVRGNGGGVNDRKRFMIVPKRGN